MHTTKPHKIVSFQAFPITRVELIKNSCAINSNEIIFYVCELHYCTTVLINFMECFRLTFFNLFVKNITGVKIVRVSFNVGSSNKLHGMKRSNSAPVLLMRHNCT